MQCLRVFSENGIAIWQNSTFHWLLMGYFIWCIAMQTLIRQTKQPFQTRRFVESTLWLSLHLGQITVKYSQQNIHIPIWHFYCAENQCFSRLLYIVECPTLTMLTMWQHLHMFPMTVYSKDYGLVNALLCFVMDWSGRYVVSISLGYFIAL